jgi:hypothetical protein
MAFPGILPNYTPAGPSADILMRRGMTQAGRQAIGTATAGGGGLAGTRAGAEAAAQGGYDAANAAAQLRAQEAQQEAMRRTQFSADSSGLFRGLLSGMGGALGAVGDSRQGAGQQIAGMAGAFAPLLLASDRRLKTHLRGATSQDIDAVRQLLMQRRRSRSTPAQPAPTRTRERATAHYIPGGPGEMLHDMQEDVDNQGGEITDLRAQARDIQRIPARSFEGPNGPVGVVAQDVERVAPSMVRRVGPDQLRAIDIPQATGTLLAGHSDMARTQEDVNRRLQLLEQRSGMQSRAGRRPVSR